MVDNILPPKIIKGIIQSGLKPYSCFCSILFHLSLFLSKPLKKVSVSLIVPFFLLHFLHFLSTSQNMASKLINILSTLLLYFSLVLLLSSPARITAQECPYPCYPAPTGPAGNNPPPAATTPPTSQGYVPNNPSTNYNPPPAGYNNNNPPNDYDNNSPPDFVNGEVPPPPEPILPWFPFYYRKPPHSDNDQSSSSLSIQQSRTSWKNMMIITTIFPLIFMTLLFH